MQEKKLFVVAESFLLPGLGVLLLPVEVAPELQLVALHTALRITLHQPGSSQTTALGSVEEIARSGKSTVRALLLTQEGAEPVPPGTEVWGTGQEAAWEELL